jgi:hypothetical protein
MLHYIYNIEQKIKRIKRVEGPDGRSEVEESRQHEKIDGYSRTPRRSRIKRVEGPEGGLEAVSKQHEKIDGHSRTPRRSRIKPAEELVVYIVPESPWRQHDRTSPASGLLGPRT